MRKKAETFNSLFKALKSSRVSFLIAAVENEKYKGASIYHYKKGVLVTDNFSQPALPPVDSITDKSDLIWCKYIFMHLRHRNYIWNYLMSMNELNQTVDGDEEYW